MKKPLQFMAVCCAGILFDIAPLQAGMIIDTSGNTPFVSLTGWQGSGQSITIESGFETFDSIGFFFDNESDGDEFDFILTEPPPFGAELGASPLFSTSFTVLPGNGPTVINIDQTFSAGQTLFALVDFRGVNASQKTMEYYETDVYSGGTSLFGHFQATSTFTPDFDHRFVASFSSPSPVPEPSSLTLLGIACVTGMCAARRRKRGCANLDAAGGSLGHSHTCN